MAANMDKEYAGIGGLPDFCKLSAQLAFGDDSSVIKEGRNVTVQGISGTGSLRIGAAFFSKWYEPSKDFYIPSPSWGNHTPIFKHSGLNVKTYSYYDPNTCSFDSKAAMADLAVSIILIK